MFKVRLKLNYLFDMFVEVFLFKKNVLILRKLCVCCLWRVNMKIVWFIGFLGNVILGFIGVNCCYYCCIFVL